MEQLETMDTKKRRMPKARTMVLAAALAVGCLLSIAAAAGLPARVYNFATGGQIYMSPDSYYGSMTIDAADQVIPIRAENGRLWFEADGLAVDITDQVDENTPYIYERTDPDTGEKGCVIVGGTADDFGWAELFLVDGEIDLISGQNYVDVRSVLLDGDEDSSFSITVKQRVVQATDEDDNIPVHDDIRPWLQAALSQLGLEW